MKRPSIPPKDALQTNANLPFGFLAHPLPGGMRDLLPEEAEEQGRLSRKVLSTFQLFGFQPVLLPAFEYAQVLERGLGGVEPTSILRFVEPETGEVVALRPDMTPQVARLVSTRFADKPGPIRLSYGGSVLRRRHERARHDQQIHQAGIELVGASGTEADLEVIRAATAALRDAGLSDFVLDIGHGAIAASLLDELTVEHRAELLECLSLKDEAMLSRRGHDFGLAPELLEPLCALLRLHGGLEVFEQARALLAASPAWPHVLELERLCLAVQRANVAPKILIDLGETRAVAYYTGPMFQILAEGPGQAVASGGRYDALYGEFGTPRPAAGAAVSVDNLRWALGPRAQLSRARVLIVTEDQRAQDTQAAQLVLQRLRGARVRAASVVASTLSEDSSSLAIDYAVAWRYSHLVRVAAGASDAAGDPDAQVGELLLSRVVGGRQVDLGPCRLADLLDQVCS